MKTKCNTVSLASRGLPGPRPRQELAPQPEVSRYLEGGGGEAATTGRVRAKRAPRSTKTLRGGEPGPGRHAIGRFLLDRLNYPLV